MNKRLILVILASVLCNIYSIAQNISKEEFNTLVDYVNCKYTEAYIEAYRGDKNQEKSIENYDKNIKDKITSVTPENPLPYKELSKLLEENGWATTERVLSSAINGWKSRYKNSITDAKLIELLKLDGFNKISKEKKDEILQVLKDKYLNGAPPSPKKEELKVSQPIANKGKLESFPNEKNTAELKEIESSSTTVGEDNKDNTLLYLIVLFALIGAVVLGYFLGRKAKLKTPKTNKSTNIDKEEDCKRCKKLELENQRLSASLKDQEKDSSELRTKNKKLEQEVRELKQQNDTKTQDQNKEKSSLLMGETIKKERAETSTPVSDATRLYADTIVDDMFYNVSEQPNEDTVFELIRSSSLSKTVQFRIFPAAYKRVINNPDFIEGCEKQKISSQPQTLEVENGEAVQDDFGKWKISKKAKVRFV